jgi:general nucleoside transport system permease protein
MSGPTALATSDAPARSKGTGWWSSQPRGRRLAWMALGVFLVLSIVRSISGQHDLTSRFTIAATITATLPILLAGLGGLVSERAGVVNIGLEGMMIAGTWGAGFFGFHWGPWGALLGSMFCGAIGGILHALATVTFGVDHVISGVAINLLANGWARFLSNAFFKGRGSGSETNSPGFDTSNLMPTITPPGFGNEGALGKLEFKHWPIISDLAAMIRGLFGSWHLYQLIALAMVPLVFWLVWRTKFGLRLRSSGEKPSAADSLGVNVNRIRYSALALSGGLAGLGGSMLVLNNSGSYQEGQTANRGFLGLASLIFGNWKPSGVLGGATLFGFFDSLQLTASGAVRGLYLAGAVGAALAAYVAFRRNRARTRTWSGLAALAAGLVLVYVTGVKMNVDLVKALPYIVTLIVLTAFSRRLRGPAAAGMPWRKGQST